MQKHSGVDASRLHPQRPDHDSEEREDREAEHESVRGPEEDPDFFAAAYAAGVVARETLRLYKVRAR